MASIDPTADQLDRLIAGSAHEAGPIRMVNLLRFRDTADYGDEADPAAPRASTGAEAYGRYGQVAMEEVAAVGGSQFYAGAAAQTVVGPDDEDWDVVAIIEYPSRAAFLKMIAKPSYRAAVPHRTAGLADTRLIMTSPLG